MSAYIKSKKCRASYIILAAVIILGIAASVFLKQLSSHIKEISEFEGRKVSADLINKAISEQFSSDSNKEYIFIQRDENGKITSVSSNTNAVNEANQQISQAVNESLKKLEHEKIYVPIGTLSGITFFTGRGKNISIKLHQTGAVSTEMKSEFTGAGVNQTKYRLYIEITVEMTAVLPGNSTDIIVKSQYLVNETVIVGEVPQMYLNRNKETMNKS